MGKYRAFGLIIESDIPLHAEEVAADSVVDLRIISGECPDSISSPIVDNKWAKVNSVEALITIEAVGTFYISHGSTITANVLPDVPNEVTRMYLFGTCMGAVLQQRGIMPLHGSSVCKEGIALVISGDSGSGKSTLAAEFISRGWKLMSDDVTPVVETDGVYYAQSTYPGQKMWEDTIHRSEATNRVVENIIREESGRSKYQLSAGDSFVYAKYPIKYVVVLGVGGDELVADEAIEYTKMDMLMRNLYRSFLVVDKDGKTEQLRMCLKLANQLRCFLVLRPGDQITEKTIADWIEDRIGEDK